MGKNLISEKSLYFIADFSIVQGCKLCYTLFIRGYGGIGRRAGFRCCHLSEGFLAVLVPANQPLPLFPTTGEKFGDFIALPRNEIARLTKSTADFAFTRVFIFSMIRTGTSVFINADQALRSVSDSLSE